MKRVQITARPPSLISCNYIRLEKNSSQCRAPQHSGGSSGRTGHCSLRCHSTLLLYAHSPLLFLSPSLSLSLFAGGNLSYLIPSGVADDLLTIDATTGVVSTKGHLDREKKERLVVPVYVTDTTRSPERGAQFDVATLTVLVTDVNDHAPEFRTGACYPLAVPENGDAAVVHTVVAFDEDSGMNGEITYAITGK